MNKYPGVIGRKLGMTQLIAEDGTVSPVTVIESHTTVTGKRTLHRDGYDALILGLAARRKVIRREFRCDADYAAGKEIGQVLELDEVFEVGQFLDVAGVTRGRGFSGVVRKYGFAGSVQTHGSHEYRRHGGSIGTNMTPGRTMKGRKMPGQHGNARVSVLNQRVARVIADQHLVLVYGGVPGARGGLVELRGSVKRKGGRK